MIKIIKNPYVGENEPRLVLEADWNGTPIYARVSLENMWSYVRGKYLIK